MVRQFSRGDVVGDLHVVEGVIDSCGRWIRRGVGGSTNVWRVREDRNTKASVWNIIKSSNDALGDML
jgi:hypothetical protein